MSQWQQQKRPFPVTLTTWGVFLIGVWNLGRAIALWQQLPLLEELPVTPDPRWQMGGAVVWSVLFLVGLGLLWRKRPFAHIIIPTLITLFTAYAIGLRLVFATTPRVTLLLPTLLLGALALFSGWALRQPAARHYFVHSAQRRKAAATAETDEKRP